MVIVRDNGDLVDYGRTAGVEVSRSAQRREEILLFFSFFFFLSNEVND